MNLYEFIALVFVTFAFVFGALLLTFSMLAIKHIQRKDKRRSSRYVLLGLLVMVGLLLLL